MGYARTELVTVDSRILSSYKRGGGTGGPRSNLLPLSKIGPTGTCPADVAAGLLAAHEACELLDADFRVTDLNRSPARSAAARKKYEFWLKSGEPKQSSSAYDEETMKDAYVSPAGKSMHNAARAIDLHIEYLVFPNVAADLQLDKAWEILKPLGWREILKEAKEGAKESWHFNFYGPWFPVYRRFKSESKVAVMAALDIGIDIYDRWEWKFIQAQLHRGGYHCGDVDGWPGSASEASSMTRRALTASGLDGHTNDPTKLFEEVSALPDSGLLWTA